MKSFKFLKLIIVLLCFVIFVACQDTANKPSQKSEVNQSMNTDKKILIVYFSQTDTTKKLAKDISNILNADIYEIIAANPYTTEDLAYYTNGRADQEQSDSSVRPKISGTIENIKDYDTIILGYPIWHGQAPRIIYTFLESYDFSKKTIIPFCTSHSSDIGTSATHLHQLTSSTTVWHEGKRFGEDTSTKELEDFFKAILD